MKTISYTYPHIRPTPHHRVSERIDKFPADAIVTHLHLAITVDEDIRWLHVSMHHVQLRFEEIQSLYHLEAEIVVFIYLIQV